MKRGLFIAFEGIDGCGKSTQMRKLVEYIFEKNKYNHVVATREPWKDTDIRKILQSDNDTYSQGRELAEMFINDRKEHMLRLIIPNICQGIHVVSDRYSFSTLAYQQTQGMDVIELLNMHKGVLIPDIIFVVDVPAEIAVDRMNNDKNTRASKHKFEKNTEFLEKLRQNYLKLAESLENHRVVVLDGTQSIDHIFEKQIKPIINQII